MLREKSCGALIFTWNGERVDFLLIKHRIGGHWSYPKGHVENDETEVETALREVKEETGLDIELLPSFRHVVNYSPRPKISKDVVFFLGYAKDSKTTIQEEEIWESGWFDIDECESRLTFENDVELLNYATEYLKAQQIYPK